MNDMIKSNKEVKKREIFFFINIPNPEPINIARRIMFER